MNDFVRRATNRTVPAIVAVIVVGVIRTWRGASRAEVIATVYWLLVGYATGIVYERVATRGAKR